MSSAVQLPTTRENAAALFRTQTAPIAKLPLDIVLRILSLLTLADIKKLSLTCRAFRAISLDANLWQSLFLRTFLRRPEQGYCLEAYKKLYSNLVNGVYTTRCHGDGIALCINGTVVTGSPNGQIVFSSGNVDAHTQKITSLLWVNEQLISGSLDNTIKVWDLTNQRCLRTLTLKDGSKGVTSLLWNGKHLISGSAKGIIQVWDIEDGTCVETLTGHEGWIYSLLYVDGKIISCSADKTIKIWDSSCFSVKTLRDSDAVKSIVWAHDTLISANDRMVNIWDCRTGKRKASFASNGGLPQLWFDGILICGGKKLQAWDLSTRKTLWEGGEFCNVESLRWSDGRLSFSANNKAYDCNFTASNADVFEEIAFQFACTDTHDNLFLALFGFKDYKYPLSIPMDRFSRMPRKEQEKIQETLYYILRQRVRQQLIRIHAHQDEALIQEQIEKSCTRKDRAAAIRNQTAPSINIKMLLVSLLCCVVVLKALSWLIPNPPEFYEK